MATPLSAIPAEVLREFKARFGSVMALAAIISFGILAWSFVQPSTYSSQVRLVYSGAAGGGGVLGMGGAAERALADLGKPGVVADIWQRNGFGPQESGEVSERVQLQLKRRIRIEPVGRQELLLSYHAESPQESLLMTRELAAYLTRDQIAPAMGADQRMEILESQISEYRKPVEQARVELETFRQSAGVLADPDDLRGEIARLETQVEVAEGSLQTAREEADRLQEDVAASSQSNLGVKQSELLARIGRANRQIEALTDEKRNLQVALATRRARLEAVEALRTQERELVRNLEVATEMLRDLVAQRDELQAGQNAAGQGGFSQSGSVSIPAAASTVSFRQLAAIGLIAGLLLPFALLAVACWLDPRVRSAERFTDRTGIPVLVQIPSLESPFEERLDRNRRWTLLIFGGLAIAFYLYLVWLRLNGVL